MPCATDKLSREADGQRPLELKSSPGVWGRALAEKNGLRSGDCILIKEIVRNMVIHEASPDGRSLDSAGDLRGRYPARAHGSVFTQGDRP